MNATKPIVDVAPAPRPAAGSSVPYAYAPYPTWARHSVSVKPACALCAGRRHAGSVVVFSMAVLTLASLMLLGMFVGTPTGPVEVRPPERPIPPDRTHIYVIPRHDPKTGQPAPLVPQRYGQAPRVVPVPDPTSPQQGRYEAHRPCPK